MFLIIMIVIPCSGMFRDVPGCSGTFRDVPCSWFYRRLGATQGKQAVDKTRNIEHPGTSRNIPEHGIIIIIMRRICKIKFSTIK